MVEMTNGKCLLSFEVAAPIQITRQTNFAAMMMSAPVNRKHTASDPYTSPRAARKMTLSRRPASARSTRMAAVCQTDRMGVGEVQEEAERVKIVGRRNTK